MYLLCNYASLNFSIKSSGKPRCPNVVEKIKDIIETNPDVSLTYCVSGDPKMNKEIDLKFRRKYGIMEELRRQQRTVTEVAFLNQKIDTCFI